MSSYERIAAAFHARIDAIAAAVDAMAPGLEEGAGLLVEAVLGDRKVIVCGVGRDATLASYAATLFREVEDGMPPLPALSVTSSEASTAESVMVRDLRALSRDGDVLICLDTGPEGTLAGQCAGIARERNLALLTLSLVQDEGRGPVIPISAEHEDQRTEFALMALNCLRREIRHLLLGE